MAKFLIIDDEAEPSAALAALLRLEGHHADSVQGPGAALEQLRRDRPDLILLDLTMPKLDGLDLLDALAQEPEYAMIPVAVFSGRDDPKSIESALSRGATDYILKGAGWDRTYARIKACLDGLPRPADPASPSANVPA